MVMIMLHMLMLCAKLQTISLRKVELEQCLMALLGTTPASNYPNGPQWKQQVKAAAMNIEAETRLRMRALCLNPEFPEAM